MWQPPFILAVTVLCSTLTALHRPASDCCGGCPAVQTHLRPPAPPHTPAPRCAGPRQWGHGPAAPSVPLALGHWRTILPLSFIFIPSLAASCVCSLSSCLLILFCAAALHSLNLTLCCTLSLILFYSILFYSILFYSILFYSILFYSIPQIYTQSPKYTRAHKQNRKLRFCSMHTGHKIHQTSKVLTTAGCLSFKVQRKEKMMRGRLIILWRASVLWLFLTLFNCKLEHMAIP